MRRTDKFLILLALGAFLFVGAPALGAPVKLSVPYTTQVLDGKWVDPWRNACEEASMMMVDEYYRGEPGGKITKARAKNLLLPFFTLENKLFGSNSDTNATRTAKVIDQHTSYNANIVRSPSLEDIKTEIEAGRPVITLHYGFPLKNTNLHFRRIGSSYHMMVITGLNHRYTYDNLLGTLGDFDHSTKKVNREIPTAIFTSPKPKVGQLIRARGTRGVYYVTAGKKYPITSQQAFKNNGWQWNEVKAVGADWLKKFTDGEPIIE